jgi:penicillin-binding protein 1C
LLAVLWWLIPACPLYRENLSWSTVLSDRQGKVLHLSLADDDRYRVKTSLADIAPVMVRATLAYEDEHYFSHPGINPLSMLRALAGQVQGIPRGGGSTLTMQYARLRFGMQTNTCGGKFQQMLRAIQLEKFYSKQEILEAYCNSAPYGGNVEGIAAASLRWCGKECRDLNTAEAVALVMLPQRPPVGTISSSRMNPLRLSPSSSSRLCVLTASVVNQASSRRGTVP